MELSCECTLRLNRQMYVNDITKQWTWNVYILPLYISIHGVCDTFWCSTSVHSLLKLDFPWYGSVNGGLSFSMCLSWHWVFVQMDVTEPASCNIKLLMNPVEGKAETLVCWETPSKCLLCSRIPVCHNWCNISASLRSLRRRYSSFLGSEILERLHLISWCVSKHADCPG